jgi:N-methylhydantoinase A
MSSEARVGVDVGGTFTDVILHDTDGRVSIRKLLSTPPSYDRAVVEAVGGLVDGPVAEVVHGTTVATNAVLERRGSPTALVTTAGFRDVLELRRLRIPHMYDLFWAKPPPLVERHLRFELNERVAADGTVVRAIDEDESRALAGRLRATGVESVAVCFLHSYLYPEHELRFGAILAEELPEANVSLSSEILREQREYERSATTVVNAYVRPLMCVYIDRIRTALDGIGIDGPLQIMQSSGGVMTSEDAKARPFSRSRQAHGGVVAARGWGGSWHRLICSPSVWAATAKASLIWTGHLARPQYGSAARYRPAACP